MLMKLTPGANFINGLQAALACADPEKAAQRMLMKLTPWDDFINILCAHFSYKSALLNFLLVTFWL